MTPAFFVGNFFANDEATICGIQSKAIYNIGEELQAAHDELADYHGGTFYAWCESIGLKVSYVAETLKWHEFVLRNAQNREYLETLPKRLIVEAARKSAPAELKQGVLNGDRYT